MFIKIKSFSFPNNTKMEVFQFPRVVIAMLLFFAIRTFVFGDKFKKSIWNEGEARLFRRKTLNSRGHGNGNLALIPDVLEHRGPTEFYIKTYRPLRVIRADKWSF